MTRSTVAYLDGASDGHAGNRRGLYVPMLALALAAGVWNHYFAVLTLAPLLVGEATRLRQVRRPDWPMYGAFVLASVVAGIIIRVIYVSTDDEIVEVDILVIASGVVLVEQL